MTEAVKRQIIIYRVRNVVRRLKNMCIPSKMDLHTYQIISSDL